MISTSQTSPIFRPTIGEICYADPKLAYTLMNAGKVGLGGYVDVGGWEILNVSGTWGLPQSTDPTDKENDAVIAAGTPIKGQLFGTVESDLWVRKVVYTVKRPNAFAGNILKAQSDYFNAKNPNIDFSLIISSYSRYVISPDFTPLENMPAAFEAVAPAGMILRFSSTIAAQFQNTRVFTHGEIPTIATISLHGTRLPSQVYGQVDTQDAIKYLKENGVWPSSADDTGSEG